METPAENNPDARSPGGSSSVRPRLLMMALGALGVVYGDIGTSPLYAVRECFSEAHPVPVSVENVLGVLSLIIWSLILVISIKYLILIMNADNRGEGGVFALMALVHSRLEKKPKLGFFVQATAILGAALLYGDGMITPAITVLSAVEGLETLTPALEPFVIPAAVGILIGLFTFQRHGTEKVGRVFGPVMLLWFGALAALGISWIAREPGIFAAFDPRHAVSFFLHNGFEGFLVLGAVFLVVTGGEAVYADMGHFGVRSIRFSWFAMVFPALLLNYLGQGALILTDPSAVKNTFFRMAPAWALYPLVALATAAAIIASQAVISGAFSLTRQALQLGYLPRMEIRHSSARQIGQIYIPMVNWLLMLCTIGLVLGFRSSGNLAAAYGIAVSTTMVLTTVLAYYCARIYWKWSAGAALFAIVPFLLFDSAFLLSNTVKIHHGGWFAFLAAMVIFVLLTTWIRGQEILSVQRKSIALSDQEFLESIRINPPQRVAGAAVYLSSDVDGVPRSILHNLKHNKILHQRVVFLTILTMESPRVAMEERVQATILGEGFFRIVAKYGFMESPHVPRLLKQIAIPGFEYKEMETTFFTSQKSLVVTSAPKMSKWRKHLFSFMERNAQRVVFHYRIPPYRVVEMGVQIEF